MSIKQQVKFKEEINFEADQENVLQKTTSLQTLADQVEKLESLQTRLDMQEDNIKNTKKQLEYISGEVIPTMMSEMGLSHLKLIDGFNIYCSLFYSF